jgi:hypothetical protein
MTPDEFIPHGQWMDVDRLVSRMWIHKSTGNIFYEDVEEVRDRGLAIYPFKIGEE